MTISDFLEHVYKGKMRKNGEKATAHFYAVRDLLVEAGITESHLLDAALLHDVLEDTDINEHYLAMKFGKKVTDLVALLSKAPDWKTSFCKMKSALDDLELFWVSYPEAIIIKIADRLHNLMTIEGFRPEKQEEYIMETKELLLPLFEQVCKQNNTLYLKSSMEYLLKRLNVEVLRIESSFCSLTHHS